MSNTMIDKYILGLLIGFVIGFMVVYLLRNMLVDGEEQMAMFVLGAFLIGMLFAGHVIYQEDVS